MTHSPRTVLVTGGSRGLGAALVQAFLDNGDRVATCSRRRSEATDTWEAGDLAERFHFEPLDLNDREATRTYLRTVGERLGPIEVLVNNAGIAPDGVLGLFPDDDIDNVVDLNLKATVHLTKLVSRQMLRAGFGRIIQISSIVGSSGYRGLSVYSATKAALEGFTRALARELGSRGITVNAVAPGYLRTEMSHGLDKDQQHRIIGRTPVGRLGEPRDVVGPVLFLASNEAEFVTGTVLTVDGGLTA